MLLDGPPPALQVFLAQSTAIHVQSSLVEVDEVHLSFRIHQNIAWMQVHMQDAVIDQFFYLGADCGDQPSGTSLIRAPNLGQRLVAIYGPGDQPGLVAHTPLVRVCNRFRGINAEPSDRLEQIKFLLGAGGAPADIPSLDNMPDRSTTGIVLDDHVADGFQMRKSNRTSAAKYRRTWPGGVVEKVAESGYLLVGERICGADGYGVICNGREWFHASPWLLVTDAWQWRTYKGTDPNLSRLQPCSSCAVPAK